MRIAMLGPFPRHGRPPSGGIEAALVRLVPALRSAGAEVSVIAAGTPAPVEEGVRRVPLPGRLSLLRAFMPLREAILAEVRRGGFDVVHAQGLVPFGLAAADVTECVRIGTAHGSHEADARSVYGPVTGALRASVVRGLALAAAGSLDAVIGVCPDPRVNVPGVPRRLLYVPNPIDERFFDLERCPDERIVVYAGGARRIKGPDVLREAWPRVAAATGACLHVIGWEGGKGWWPDGVTVLPALPFERLAEELARASAVVMPSRFEVAPVLLTEAWAAAAPVVASTAGGLASLGLGAAVQVPPEEPSALAVALIRLLDGEIDPSPLIDEGRRRAESSRPAVVAQAHLDLYRSLGVG